MRTFVLRARKGPTSPAGVEKAFGYPDHFEVIAHSIVSALMISKYTRDDVALHVVLEGNPAPPLTVTFNSPEMGSLGGFDETTIADVFKRILALAPGLQKGQRVEAEPGIWLHKISFEALVRSLSEELSIYVLDRKGHDIRQTELGLDCGFILTDHIPMQKNTLSLLKRLGIKRLSLGPKVLFASHCITLIHNEMDRRESSR